MMTLVEFNYSSTFINIFNPKFLNHGYKGHFSSLSVNDFNLVLTGEKWHVLGKPRSKTKPCINKVKNKFSFIHPKSREKSIHAMVVLFIKPKKDQISMI